MNKLLIILLNIAALLTGACASQTTTPAQLQVAAADTELSPSQQYRIAVNKHAAGKSMKVYWIHIPDDDDVDKSDNGN